VRVMGLHVATTALISLVTIATSTTRGCGGRVIEN